MGDRQTNMKELLRKQSAYLSGESKEKPDFKGIDISNMIFSGEDFSEADLSGADCRGTHFNKCKFFGTNFTGARLSGAEFYICKMDMDNEHECYIPKFIFDNKIRADFNFYFETSHRRGCPITPDSGSFNVFNICDYVEMKDTFLGYKILYVGENKYAVATLRISPDDKVIAFENGKCRCARAFVVSIDDGIKSYQSGVSPIHVNICRYNVGEYVTADYFNDDWLIECSHGIHFFLTRKEAEEYKRYFLEGC